jgi:hypothetical protein
MSTSDEALLAPGALQRALMSLDRSRAPESADLELVSELWLGFADGSWCVVERFDRDGKRYLVASV